ncbi:MAG TPA: acetyl-CoA carboxylase biotin carboxyl carrier protein [Paracoccus solventivorans]|uniref:Biotin carboxyl carrier protein of acetyl-CoA carboxylase n=1 Tax=Paracoccus solventivorans TaxID=53463 RepID=A0A832PK82_9RHOB|nr:acetyl-CoA carboxylase biotin carboxyl carrier protein [Paracoccus solventivorans]HHW33069.1 acetyl-CoA carboxylase biotin carboxyl carrier protein [Paracoccus solventivorans]
MSDKDPTRHHAEDTAFIQALAELLNRNELTELKVEREYGEDDRLTVELSKHGRQVMVQSAPVYAPQAPQAPAAAPAAPGAAAPTPASDPANHPGAVPSPMVGTAYLSPEPGAAPFVTVGQQVAEGDTLMIVEAMKTMNHIPAPRAGTVRRVLVEDGTPVEFGTTLMIVE